MNTTTTGSGQDARHEQLREEWIEVHGSFNEHARGLLEQNPSYFERVLDTSGGNYLLGRKLSYVDLSLFQVVEGLRYAFPKRMKRFERRLPRVLALHDRVARRPRIAAYLASKRRIPFNEWGIFRRYKELDR